MGNRRKPLIISAVVISVLIGVGLAIFFCIPRNPHIDFQDPTYSNVQNTDTVFSVDVIIPFTVDNPNYYDLKLKSLNLEIDYNGVYIGDLVQSSKMTFKKRAKTQHELSTTISTRDTGLLGSIQSDLDSGNPLHVKFHGPAKFEAVSITVTRNLNFEKDLHIDV